MKTVDTHRAHIPTSMFKDIVQDLEIAMNQCECSNILRMLLFLDFFLCSRLYQLLDQTVALFKSTIRDTPECIIPGRMTTKGRVEYHFSVFGGLSVLVIEVKYNWGAFGCHRTSHFRMWWLLSQRRTPEVNILDLSSPISTSLGKLRLVLSPSTFRPLQALSRRRLCLQCANVHGILVLGGGRGIIPT